MHLPNAEEIQITSLEDAATIIKLLVLKIKEVEDREPVRDQGLVEEILHLRRETREGFGHLRQETREGFQQLREELVEKIDNNTLATKGLEGKLSSLESTVKGKFDSLESSVKGGFDNIGKILQDISNKLDK